MSYLLKVLLPVISEIMKQGCFQSYASLHPQGPRWQVVSTHAKRQSIFTEEMIQDQVRGKKQSTYRSIYLHVEPNVILMSFIFYIPSYQQGLVFLWGT